MRVIKPPAPSGEMPGAATSTPPENRREPPAGRVYPDVPHDMALWVGKATMDAIRRDLPGVRMCMAGSIRRERPVSHDIDILLSPPSPELRAWCERHGETLWSGPEKVSCDVPLPDESGWVQIDFRFIAPESWGAALQYFTGSRMHNVSLRSIAKSRGMILNEYGLWSRTDGSRVDDGTEGGIYAALGLKWKPPRYREYAIGRGPTAEREREADRAERVRQRREEWDERQRRLTALYRGEAVE